MKAVFLSEIKSFSSQKGIGLISAIMIITALTSLILVMARFSWTNGRRNALESGNEKAFYLSESGIEYALKRSVDLNNWNWNQSGNYAGGKVIVSVSYTGRDTVQIKSRSESGNTAKCNSLFLNVINPLNYSVYISGKVNGTIGYDSIERLRFDVLLLPSMNLDSLKQVAQNQGYYYTKNATIDNHSPDFKYWSNPYNHNKDATVIYAEKNLIIDKTDRKIGAIFVVMGKLILQNSKGLEGIFFMANPSSKQVVDCQGKKSQHILQGAVTGNTDINSSNGSHGPELTVYYNNDFIEKFYTYSLTNSLIIKKINWVANY